MADRDPVEVEADALMEIADALAHEPVTDGNLHVERRRRIYDALRTEANRAGEAMREAAAKCCDAFDSPPSDSDFVMGQATAAQQIRASIRALPLSEAPASPWRSMDSAPKDRRILLKVCPRVHLGDTSEEVAVGKWHASHNREEWKWAGWHTDLGPFTFASGWALLPALDLPTPPAKDETA